MLPRGASEKNSLKISKRYPINNSFLVQSLSLHLNITGENGLTGQNLSYSKLVLLEISLTQEYSSKKNQIRKYKTYVRQK